MNFVTRNRTQLGATSTGPTAARVPLRRTRWVVALTAAVVLGGLAFGGPGANAAAAILNVFVTNDTAHPVPTKAVGTTAVSGSVTVTNQPEQAPQPLWQGTPYSQSQVTIQVTSYQCSDDFPVPAGKVLYVTRVVTAFSVPPGADAISNVTYTPLGGTSPQSVSAPVVRTAPVRQSNGNFDGYVGTLELGLPMASISVCYASDGPLHAESTVIGYLVPAP